MPVYGEVATANIMGPRAVFFSVTSYLSVA